MRLSGIDFRGGRFPAIQQVAELPDAVRDHLATSTLIAVMSVIRGMDLYIADAVSNMGANGFRIVRLAIIGQVDPKKYLELQRRNPELQVEEYAFLKSNATLLSEVGMEMTRSASIGYANDSVDSVSLRGVTPNMAVITNIEATAGRFITDTENSRRVQVVFIGSDIQERFFVGWIRSEKPCWSTGGRSR